VFGIACAACHSPHASHSAARLIRELDIPSAPADLGELAPRDALCVSCHTPRPDELAPSASSGALWLGRARVPAAERAGWDWLQSRALHRDVPGGCVGCHGGAAAAAGGKVDHSFAVDPRTCGSCHGKLDSAQANQVVEQRALGLARQLDEACGAAPLRPGTAPPHAEHASTSCDDPRLTRARYEVALVLEDRAAAVHNAALARELLDDAQRQLGARGQP
jgi:hypothetical protein